jgi:hypothetical protein
MKLLTKLKFNSESSRIIKNLFAVNLSFVALFSAFNSTSSVQSVLNQEAGLGTTSQAIIFGSQLLTSLVLPQVISKTLGFKWAMTLGEFLILTYIAMQLYPRWSTIVPSKQYNSVYEQLEIITIINIGENIKILITSKIKNICIHIEFLNLSFCYKNHEN